MNTLNLNGSTELPTAVSSVRVPALLCDIQHGSVIIRCCFYLPVFIRTNINGFLQGEKNKPFVLKPQLPNAKQGSKPKPFQSPAPLTENIVLQMYLMTDKRTNLYILETFIAVDVIPCVLKTKH